MKKKIIVTCIVFMMVIGVCGCTMKKEKKETADEIVSAMETHLLDKYGPIQFKIKGFFSAGWDYPYDLLNLSTTVDGVDEHFFVQRHENEEGRYIYKDSYFGVAIAKDLEELASEYAAKHFIEYKVFAVALGYDIYPDALDGNCTIDDLVGLDDENLHIVFAVYVSENDFKDVDAFENTAKEFVEDWKTADILSRPRVFRIPNEDFVNLKREDCWKVYSESKIEYKND